MPLRSYCDRAFPPKGLGQAAGGTCPIAREPGQNKLRFTARRCKAQQAPHSPRRAGGIAVPPRHNLLKAKIAQVPSRIPEAGFAHGSVYISPWRPASVFMCVFPYVCVWLCVCGGVSGCVWVSFRIGLSANLLENENKPGSLAAVPQAQLQHRFQTDSNRRADDRAHTLPFRPS